jgi:hypothetical protein
MSPHMSNISISLLVFFGLIISVFIIDNGMSKHNQKKVYNYDRLWSHSIDSWGNFTDDKALTKRYIPIGIEDDLKQATINLKASASLEYDYNYSYDRTRELPNVNSNHNE